MGKSQIYQEDMMDENIKDLKNQVNLLKENNKQRQNIRKISRSNSNIKPQKVI